MLLVYCESCGFRISQEDLARGHATIIEENRYQCTKCLPVRATVPERKTPPQTSTPVKPPTSSSKSPLHTPPRGTPHIQNARPASTPQIPAAREPNARPTASKSTGISRKPAEAKPMPVPLLAGAGAAVALVLILFLSSGKSNDSTLASDSVNNSATPPAQDSSRKELPVEGVRFAQPTGGIDTANADKKSDRAMPSWMQGVDTSRDSGPRRPKEDSQRNEGSETIFVDDALPPKADENGTANVRFVSWRWMPRPAPVFSRDFSHTFSGDPAEKVHQHYFEKANPPLRITPADTLFAYVYIDPAAPPKTIMLQWNDGSWEHRAYWGENKIPFGKDGTASQMPMGLLPAAGQWVRLEVPASKVGLTQPVIEINGCSFDHFGGRVYWDKVGVLRNSPAAATGTPAPQPSAASTEGLVTLGKVTSKQLDGGKEFDNFQGKKKLSRAIWAKSTPLSTLTATFQAPSEKYGSGNLVITSLRHERKQPCRIALELNGKVFFDGVDPATDAEWRSHQFPVPDGLLKNGTNTLRILNKEEQGKTGAPPWYMVHAVELFATPAK